MKYDKIKVKASLMRLASEIIDIIDGTAGEGDQNQQDARQAAMKTKERIKHAQPETK